MIGLKNGKLPCNKRRLTTRNIPSTIEDVK
jgi:hypothetical protein